MIRRMVKHILTLFSGIAICYGVLVLSPPLLPVLADSTAGSLGAGFTFIYGGLAYALFFLLGIGMGLVGLINICGDIHDKILSQRDMEAVIGPKPQ